MYDHRITPYLEIFAFAGGLFFLLASILDGWHDRIERAGGASYPILAQRPILLSAVVAFVVFAIGALLLANDNS